MKKLKKILIISVVAAFAAGCSDNSKTASVEKVSIDEEQSKDKIAKKINDKNPRELKIISPDEGAAGAEESGVDDSQSPEKDAKDEPSKNESPQNEPPKNEPGEKHDFGESDRTRRKGKIVVLDPGHSSIVTGGKEPIGPGATEYKLADTSGTSGVASGMPEYELVLIISLQLKEELEGRGYTVILTRESNNVPLSCVQRAEVANNAGADAFVRIHADGWSDQSVHGAMTISPTPNNPFIPELYEESRRLSDCVIKKLCKATGCRNRGVWETDSMSGSNWSKVPVTIVEMGFMTNPEEDMLMQQPEYQRKIVEGIANGIDAFLCL